MFLSHHKLNRNFFVKLHEIHNECYPQIKDAVGSTTFIAERVLKQLSNYKILWSDGICSHLTKNGCKKPSAQVSWFLPCVLTCSISAHLPTPGTTEP